jgi:hypothetical protein
MMNEFEMRYKVRCHRGGLWKTVGAASKIAARAELAAYLTDFSS